MSKTPTNKKIYPLHCHTTYSLLDGVSSPREYVKYCKENGLEACSCTDHGYLMGLYDLVQECKAEDIMAIPGLEAYLHPGEDYEPAPGRRKFDYYHLTLWAYNNEGYKTLLELSNRSWGHGRVISRWGNLKPRMTWEDLEECNVGIICGSGCIEGPIVKPYLRGEKKMANLSANRLIDIFGDRLFMEVMPHRVDRDWKTKNVIQVSGANGVTYTFGEDDILITNEGEITAKEAMAREVTEIFGLKTQRSEMPNFSTRTISLD